MSRVLATALLLYTFPAGECNQCTEYTATSVHLSSPVVGDVVGCHSVRFAFSVLAACLDPGLTATVRLRGKPLWSSSLTSVGLNTFTHTLNVCGDALLRQGLQRLEVLLSDRAGQIRSMDLVNFRVANQAYCCSESDPMLIVLSPVVGGVVDTETAELELYSLYQGVVQVIVNGNAPTQVPVRAQSQSRVPIDAAEGTVVVTVEYVAIDQRALDAVGPVIEFVFFAVRRSAVQARVLNPTDASEWPADEGYIAEVELSPPNLSGMATGAWVGMLLINGHVALVLDQYFGAAQYATHRMQRQREGIQRIELVIIDRRNASVVARSASATALLSGQLYNLNPVYRDQMLWQFFDTLQSLQHPNNCGTARLLVMAPLEARPIAEALWRTAAALILALRTNRTLVTMAGKDALVMPGECFVLGNCMLQPFSTCSVPHSQVVSAVAQHAFSAERVVVLAADASRTDVGSVYFVPKQFKWLGAQRFAARIIE